MPTEESSDLDIAEGPRGPRATVPTFIYSTCSECHPWTRTARRPDPGRHRWTTEPGVSQQRDMHEVRLEEACTPPMPGLGAGAGVHQAGQAAKAREGVADAAWGHRDPSAWELPGSELGMDVFRLAS